MQGRINPNEVPEVKANSTMTGSGAGSGSWEGSRIVHVVMFEFKMDAEKKEVDSVRGVILS